MSASANVVRAGESVILTAFGKDAQQSALTYVWAATDATTLSATTGGTVVFSATAPGDYAVTCVANDGIANSTPATVTLTVLSATANRPPGAAVGLAAQRGAHARGGHCVTLTLTARRTIPTATRSPTTSRPIPSTPPTFSLHEVGRRRRRSRPSQDGVYVFYVTAHRSERRAAAPGRP